MRPADIIKSTLTMQQVAERYGFTPNRSGFLPCPFHGGDNTPSLKIYPDDKGWHCFGCGAGGDVIDFVRQLFSIDFRQAVARLNADFNLGLVAGKVDQREVMRYRAQQAEKERQLRAYRREHDKHTSEYRRLWAAKRDKAPTDPDGPVDPEYIEALHRLPALEEWLDGHPWR